jgi:hypothetical protein
MGAILENRCRSVITAMPEHAADPVDDFWSLPLDDHPAMADVRRWVRQRLGGVVSEAKLEDIVLVVVELVTNAEVHTSSPKSLVMSHWRDTVRIEVTDGDPSLPVLQPPIHDTVRWAWHLSSRCCVRGLGSSTVPAGQVRVVAVRLSHHETLMRHLGRTTRSVESREDGDLDVPAARNTARAWEWNPES